LPTDRIAFHTHLQYLSVRDEERYQHNIRHLSRGQQDTWLSGVLIPSYATGTEQEQLHLYLLRNGNAYKVGRLRNSMVTPIHAHLLEQFSEHQRVVPVIAKVAPGTGRSSFGIIAYAKTDLVQFPTY